MTIVADQPNFLFISWQKKKKKIKNIYSYENIIKFGDQINLMRGGGKEKSIMDNY